MKIVISAILSLFVTVPLLAQNKSAKRGIGWDEKTQKMSGLPISKMAPGVSGCTIGASSPVTICRAQARRA